MMRTLMIALGALLAGGVGGIWIYAHYIIPPTDMMARLAAIRDTNGYFFQNASEVFPTRTVARSEVSAPLPEDLSALDGFTYTYEGKARTLADLYTDMETAGLLILHDGVIVHESYARGADAGTRFTSWSLVKSLTSTLVGLAIAEGYITDVDDLLIKYLPELAGTAYETVSIKHALQMSSGIRYDPLLWEGEMDDTVKVLTNSALLGKRPRFDMANAFKQETPPGTRFNYNTAESQVLIELVRRTTDMDAADYLEKTLWRPLGMTHDAAWILDRPGPDGAEIGGALFNAALRDWARFGLFIAQNGVWKGQPLLPSDWVDRATVSDEDHLKPGQVHPNPNRGYAWHWWTYSNGNFTASGAHGQSLYIDRKNALVVARASAWPEGYVRAYDDQSLAMYDALAAWFSDERAADIAR